MSICQWPCLSDSSSPSLPLHLLYVMSPGSWFVLNVLYCWIFKTKTLAQCVDYLSANFLGSVIRIFLYFMMTLTALSKFLIMKTLKEKTPITAIPLHFKCFISCSNHFKSMRQGLLLSLVHKWKQEALRICAVCPKSVIKWQSQDRNTEMFNYIVCILWYASLLLTKPTHFLIFPTLIFFLCLDFLIYLLEIYCCFF